VLKAPPKPTPPVYEPRWTVWGAGYGASNRTSGDLAVIGSHDLSARTAGGAAGLDYRLTPDTVVGLALAGRGSAAARAMPSRPVSTAQRNPARPILRRHSPSLITGCPPTGLPWATI
jgi:hypothetical protein